MLSISGAGVRGGRARDLGGCRTKDAPGPGAKGTPGGGSEQRVPGQVTLCRESGGSWGGEQVGAHCPL